MDQLLLGLVEVLLDKVAQSVHRHHLARVQFVPFRQCRLCKCLRLPLLVVPSMSRPRPPVTGNEFSCSTFRASSPNKLFSFSPASREIPPYGVSLPMHFRGALRKRTDPSAAVSPETKTAAMSLQGEEGKVPAGYRNPMTFKDRRGMIQVSPSSASWTGFAAPRLYWEISSTPYQNTRIRSGRGRSWSVNYSD